jgi:proline racemase
LGTTFDVKVVGEVNYGNFGAVIPQVTGNAYITGEHTFLIDAEDELKYGFILR